MKLRSKLKQIDTHRVKAGMLVLRLPSAHPKMEEQCHRKQCLDAVAIPIRSACIIQDGDPPLCLLVFRPH